MFNVDTDCCAKIPLTSVRFFSSLIKDYIIQSEKIAPFYGEFPDKQGFEKQIGFKKNTHCNREVLVNSLKKQYQDFQISKSTQVNISALSSQNTFTITTGHQLNLFTGPLYFLYKIISTINLTEQLSKEFPDYKFVPVYWMATEDHDFDEINFFNFKGRKIQWNSNQTGAVGRFSTDGLSKLFEVFSSQLNLSSYATELKKLFEQSYLKHSNLAYATRFLVNELFGKYGLVIIDADNKELKQEFVPFVKNDLINHTAFKLVTHTATKLKEQGYKIQVNPREINLFYLKDKVRERIVFKEDHYVVNNTNISFSKEEILVELERFPERFSPNVILRPLYQEVILPNLCYIGGGGELAYWFELKHFFESSNVLFPILLPRNSVQFVSKKQLQKLKKLSISIEDVFLNQNELINNKVAENSKVRIDFSSQKEVLKQQFLLLKEVAQKTDKSFIGAVNAQEKKQLKGLENLEKKWLKAEKKNQQNFVDRIVVIHSDLFPNQSLEERQRNFSEIFQELGLHMVVLLKENLNPLEFSFVVLLNS